MDSELNIKPPCVSVLGSLGLLLAGCSSDSAVQATNGYGERPVAPEAAIAQAASSRDVNVVADPDPFYLRTESVWQYGWRVCAELDSGNRQGFFLMRGNEIIHQAVVESGNEQLSASETRQYCPELVNKGEITPPSLGSSRIDVKN